MIDDVLLGLRLDADLAAWRAEVREFLESEIRPWAMGPYHDPTELTGLTGEFERAHHRRAGERGYLGISMPAEVGGGGRPPSWKAIYDFEAAYHDAPSIDTGVTLCGHALLHHGSSVIRSGELAAMIAGRMTACIAYSEPDAGSDLGALTSQARRDGAVWVLDGVKTLVTGGHRADVCLTLVRTAEGPPKSSMTMFLVPMDTAGVTVERRPTINGWTLEDVRFEGVRLGDDRVVGEVGAGWGQVLGALGAERAGLAYLGWATRRLEEIVLFHGDDPRVVDLVVAHGRVRRASAHVLDLLDRGEPLGHAGSVAKVGATELLQTLARFGAEQLGAWAAARATLLGSGSRSAYEQLERIHPTIGAGANEVQRDTIARFGLGL